MVKTPMPCCCQDQLSHRKVTTGHLCPPAPPPSPAPGLHRDLVCHFLTLSVQAEEHFHELVGVAPYGIIIHLSMNCSVDSRIFLKWTKWPNGFQKWASSNLVCQLYLIYVRLREESLAQPLMYNHLRYHTPDPHL